MALRLCPDDIEAIADAVYRRMKAAEEVQLDTQFLASLPVEEIKRRARKQMREERTVKASGKGR